MMSQEEFKKLVVAQNEVAFVQVFFASDGDGDGNGDGDGDGTNANGAIVQNANVASSA